MTLAPGTRLGPYEFLAPLGAGGMGEVWKAKDTRLDRFVAVKVLPEHLAKDREALTRFEREAKTVAALNHPNITGIHDFATQGETAYVVMELLEGESLRTRLQQGPLAPRKVTELAIQMARGLAAAHEKGVVHRDLKPDNLWVTKEGRLKILDFGLAKQLPIMGAGSDSIVPTAVINSDQQTEKGRILGTSGYMSPEQVRGETIDARSDIFSFGVVLYEMLTGRRAFSRDTASDTLAAILRDDPPGLEGTGSTIPLALRHIVGHCVEKQPSQRFQDVHDVAFALESLSSSESSAQITAPFTPRNRRITGIWAAVGAVLLLAAGFLGWALKGGTAVPPTFKRLTFAPGTVESARFGPDGRTIFFSARIAGAKSEIFILHPGDEEPKSLGTPDSLLLGVSSANEIFLLRAPVRKVFGLYRGLLGQVPTGGGALKELQEEVVEAAWDGQGMAALLTLNDQNETRLEFPIGKTLFVGNAGQSFFRFLRLSPDGQRLAFMSRDNQSDAKLETVDRAGNRKTLFTLVGDGNGATLTGLAWGPLGELWFTELQGDQTALWGLSGTHRRLLWRGHGLLELMDISPDGRLLMAAHQVRRGALVQRVGEPQARDLSIQSGTTVRGISADGRSLLLMESPALDGGTTEDRAYIRPTDGGPPLRLARGYPRSLSPDGRWVNLEISDLDASHLDPTLAGALRQAGLDPAKVLDPKTSQPFLLFVPTGLGRPWALALPHEFENADPAYLLPDGQQLVFIGDVKDKANWYLMDRKGGVPQALAPDGYGLLFAGLLPLSPDGKRFIVTGNARDWFTVPVPPVPGQAPLPMKGILPGERLLGWASDNRTVFVRPELSVLPVTIHRVDPSTGARTFVQALAPPDRAGHLQTRNVFVTPDAKTFTFSFDRKLSELYLVEGLK